MTRGIDVAERFWSKVDRSAGPDGCWLWTAGLDEAGYGRFNPTSRVKVKAHRFAYELLVGPIPDGLQLDHVYDFGCRHRNCVNPAHLEPVTGRENTRRRRVNQGWPRNPSHCKHGHLFDEVNTGSRREGSRVWRSCRACGRDRQRKYQARKAARVSKAKAKEVDA